MTMEIIVSQLAVKPTDIRLFPVSRNRSARIHKKLVKRFGDEFKMEPAMYVMGRKIIAHPTLYAKLQQEVG